MKKMKPLTPSKGKIEESFTRAFCATLPSEKDVSAVSKAFCATLPGEPDDVRITKAFCATLPSERDVKKKTSEVLKTVIKK